MKVELEFAELHNPLFLAGTNLQMKLIPNKRAGMHLFWDMEEKHLLVYFGQKVAIVPGSNVSSMTPRFSAEFEIPVLHVDVKEMQPTKPRPIGNTIDQLQGKVKVTAQVSGPTQHVFEQGPGKVKD